MKILLSISLIANTIFMGLLANWKNDGATWEVPCIFMGIFTVAMVVSFIIDSWD